MIDILRPRMIAPGWKFVGRPGGNRSVVGVAVVVAVAYHRVCFCLSALIWRSAVLRLARGRAAVQGVVIGGDDVGGGGRGRGRSLSALPKSRRCLRSREKFGGACPASSIISSTPNSGNIVLSLTPNYLFARSCTVIIFTAPISMADICRACALRAQRTATSAVKRQVQTRSFTASATQRKNSMSTVV